MLVSKVDRVLPRHINLCNEEGGGSGGIALTLIPFETKTWHDNDTAFMEMSEQSNLSYASKPVICFVPRSSVGLAVFNQSQMLLRISSESHVRKAWVLECVVTHVRVRQMGLVVFMI